MFELIERLRFRKVTVTADLRASATKNATQRNKPKVLSTKRTKRGFALSNENDSNIVETVTQLIFVFMSSLCATPSVAAAAAAAANL